ncbi:MAG: hypothetical protein M3261_07325 [Thermoproteota archaeon]|nr:hypothetical protein [Thermoproteota archaeon]
MKRRLVKEVNTSHEMLVVASAYISLPLWKVKLSLCLCLKGSGLTTELTGRDEPPIESSLADESNAIRAPVE